MSKVIALIYADAKVPSEIYEEVHRLQLAGGIELIDVAEVEVKDNGKLKFENAMTLPLVVRSHGHFLPAFVGLIFFQPPHLASDNDNVRQALQAISLDQNFISVLTTEVEPRNSVLFLYFSMENAAGLRAAMLQHGGRAVEITLSTEQEDKLHRLFRGQNLEITQKAVELGLQ